MIVIIQKDTQEPAMRQLAVRLMNQGVRTPGQDADVLTLVGDTWRLDPEGLLALPYVLDVRRITPPYRLAGRAAHPENTVVEVGSARIGAEFCLIAGPCAVESQVQMAGVARRVKAAGAQLLRGGVFKPRTSPYSFQGLGQAGIPLLVDAGQEAGLPVVTEITDPRQLDDLADVDVLQVGARNMQNFPLLQALGQVRKPVLLKRGMSATVTELLQAHISPQLTVHDFRMVPGPTHTNLIFDAAVPVDLDMSDEALAAEIRRLVHSEWEEHYAIVTIDRVYA